jgi:hypothetical protein
MPTNAIASQNERASSTTLGALWILYAIFRLISAIVLLFYSGTATVMFGALLTRVPDPYMLMTTFHVVYIGAIVVTVLSGIFGLLAGVSMLAAKPAARPLALIASVLSLSNLPFGTTLGIYTLIVFLV